MVEINKELLERTKDLDRQFDGAIAKLAGGPKLDLRVFFTMAHGYITRRISENVDLFNSPDALMRLNDSFATTYLKALAGSPHDDWKRAFKFCNAESDAISSGLIGLAFIGPVGAESCGVCMARVHIKRDLKDALLKVRDVDPQDYGNVLTFVQEGNLYAEIQLRGRIVGPVAMTIPALAGPIILDWMNIDVKKWRNEVFETCYGKRVPDPSKSFLEAYERRKKG